MDRRSFLRLSALVAGAAVVPPGARAEAVPLRLVIDPAATGRPIPADFTGLSYETAQLANPAFFSGANTQLVTFVRRLGNAGVLRIGGNTSAFSLWTVGNAADPGASDEAAGPDTGQKAAPRRPVTPAAIRNLRDFLDATGWTLIYGLNMGGEPPETAADEADFVMKTVGPRLVAFQLCNEPDLFYRNGVRDKDYDYARFAAEWRRWFAAVRRRVPYAPFAGPDTAFNHDWLVPFARRFKKDVRFLSQHYYAEGPPSDPSMTIERLLKPDPRLGTELDGMSGTSRDTGLPFRMTETNSCWGGGKQAVSDTFASALWGAELMYKVAAAGGSGINFHGGGYGWYTPIAGTPASGFLARPLFYGMLMFAEAGGGRLVRADIDNAAGEPLVSGFAVRNVDGALKAAVFNKNPGRDVTLTIDAKAPSAEADVIRLAAPRLDDTSDVTFGGAPAGRDGSWSPLVTERVPVRNGIATLALPRASAALVRFAAGT